MLTRGRFLVLLGSGAAFAAAGVTVGAVLPGAKPAGAYPEIRYGRESCSFCGMGIDDARFASAWRAADGSEQHFDDIGCLVSAVRRDRPDERTRLFVHDYRDESWLDAPTATYVLSPSIKTPMAYGVAAVSSPAAVEGLVPQAPAAAQRWEQVLQQLERTG